MSDKEILNKAFEKAKAGGWKPEETPFQMIQFEGIAVPMTGLLFDHGFARGLWDKNPGALVAWRSKNSAGEGSIPNWQYHLQMMVISDNPLKYLGENI